MRLAIVGSQLCAWKSDHIIRTAKLVIAGFCRELGPDELVSGGATGVDTWAEEYDHERPTGIKIFLPTERSWPAFKARNIQIGDYCDQLLAIRSSLSTTYGSGWTADYTESLGKPVYRITL